ncbi:hypothetical protein [Kribbella alba]
MSFQDLPKNWSEFPLSDPTLAADVVDLQINVGDRRLGIFKALLCDQEDRFLMTVDLNLPGRIQDVRPSSCSKLLEPVAIPLQDLPGGGALVLALGRPGPAEWPAVDSEWAEAATQACRAVGVRLIGFYIATTYQVRRAEVSAIA